MFSRNSSNRSSSNRSTRSNTRPDPSTRGGKSAREQERRRADKVVKNAGRRGR